MTITAPLDLVPCKDTSIPTSMSLWVAPSWRYPDFIKLLLSSPDRVAQGPSSETLPTVPNTIVIRVSYLGNTLYFKYFRPERGWWRSIRDIWRGSKAYRAWQGARLLLGEGLRTPEVIAVVEGRGIGRGGISLLVTLEMAGIPLRRYLREGQLALSMQAKLASDLGKEIAHLHRLHITHGDLHPGNILVEEKRGRGFCFAYLDTEGVSRTRSILNRDTIRDLSLLNHPNLGPVAPSIRLRFLMAYVKANPGLGYSPQRLSREIQKASDHRYSRKRKREGSALENRI